MNDWIHVVFNAAMPGSGFSIGEIDMRVRGPLDCPGKLDVIRETIRASKTKDGAGFPEGTNIVVMGWQRYEDGDVQ